MPSQDEIYLRVWWVLLTKYSTIIVTWRSKFKDYITKNFNITTFHQILLWWKWREQTSGVFISPFVTELWLMFAIHKIHLPTDHSLVFLSLVRYDRQNNKKRDIFVSAWGIWTPKNTAKPDHHDHVFHLLAGCHGSIVTVATEATWRSTAFIKKKKQNKTASHVEQKNCSHVTYLMLTLSFCCRRGCKRCMRMMLVGN